jgi:hypothetical protein
MKPPEIHMCPHREELERLRMVMLMRLTSTVSCQSISVISLPLRKTFFALIYRSEEVSFPAQFKS